jgi:hypothetical protein
MKNKDLIEQLHECKRGLRLATPRDFNAWWRLMEQYKVLEEAMPELLQLVEDLMPGIGGLALQNYARVNDAPLAVRKALRALESGDGC